MRLSIAYAIILSCCRSLLQLDQNYNAAGSAHINDDTSRISRRNTHLWALSTMRPHLSNYTIFFFCNTRRGQLRGAGEAIATDTNTLNCDPRRG